MGTPEEIKEKIANPLLTIGADCYIHCKPEYQNCMECFICNQYLDQILALFPEYPLGFAL